MSDITIAKTFLKYSIEGIKEIIKSNINEDFIKAVDMIDKMTGKVIISGVGKSGYVGQKIAATMISVGIPAVFINSTDALHGDIGIVRSNDVAILISSSGTTKETCCLFNFLKKIGVRVISIVGKKNSFLDQNADLSIIFDNHYERKLPLPIPSVSSICSMAICDAITYCIIVRQNITKEDYKRYHPGGALGRDVTKIMDVMRKTNIPLVKAHVTIQKGIVEMSAKGMGIVAVVGDRNKIIGVVSDGDLRRHLGKTSLQNKIDTIMTKDPKVLHEDFFVADALEIMQKNKILNIFVVNKVQKIVGVVQMYDLLSF